MRRSPCSVGMLAVFAFLCCGAAQAAGPDCAKAASRIERLICRTPDLVSLDSQLNGAYQGALDRSAAPAMLRQEQLAWLKTRDACADARCLTRAYGRRVSQLSARSDQPKACSGATTPEVDACAAEHARWADLELGRYVAAARGRLAKEAGDGSAGAKQALAQFDKGQAAWTAYRKAECDAVYSWWSEGTIRGAMYGGCMRTVTKARTLAIWATWLSFMDSTPALMPKPVD